MSEQRWIPVAERLPDEFGAYLVYAPSTDPKMPLLTMTWFVPEDGRWGLVPVWSDAVTHWMPLPEPPEDNP